MRNLLGDSLPELLGITLWGGVGRMGRGNLLGRFLNYFRGEDLEGLKCVNIWGRSGYTEMRSTEPWGLAQGLAQETVGGPN